MNKTLWFISLFLPVIMMSQENGHIETAHGSLHYKTYGSGEPLLIINGGPGLDSAGFIPLAKSLSDNYKTILFDQRGTGKSKLEQANNSTVTMALMVQDMETIRKHLKIERWIVLGHSFGGFLAEYYAIHHPEAIKAMILSSTGGIDLKILDYFNANIQIRLSQMERDSLKYWNDRVNQGDTTKKAKYHRAKFLASAYLYKKEYIPNVAKRLAFGGYPKIRSLVFQDMRKIDFDCRAGLKNFEKPVLIIQGRQDITGDGVAYETHMALKTSTLVFINESCHYSWWEQEAQFKSQVNAFMASVD